MPWPGPASSNAIVENSTLTDAKDSAPSSARLRQAPPQHQCNDEHGEARDPIDRRPPAKWREQSGHTARREDAGQQAAHGDTDRPSPALRFGQRRRHRHQYLCRHREQTCHRGAGRQHRKRIGETADELNKRGRQHEPHGQRAPLQHVVQWHEQQQSAGVGDLCDGHGECNRCIVRLRVDERLSRR
jgi:hypothetical protein